MKAKSGKSEKLRTTYLYKDKVRTEGLSFTQSLNQWLKCHPKYYSDQLE